MIMSKVFAYARKMKAEAHLRAEQRGIGGRQRGISLIEGILYLVLALSLVVGGIVLFQNAQTSNRVTEAARGIVTLASETRALHQNARDFGTAADITPALINAGAVPSNFLNGAAPTEIVHPWGGQVTVEGDGQQFSITLAGVPSDACVRLTPVDTRGQGIAGIGIASVSFDGGTTPDPAPVTPVDAATGCGNNTTADVVYTYDR
jgi:Tfp pilus assembly protein PilW